MGNRVGNGVDGGRSSSQDWLAPQQGGSRNGRGGIECADELGCSSASREAKGQSEDLKTY